MLDVSTMNGSRLTLKTAGMESTAKATSVVSMTIRAMNSGVARRRPFSVMKNRPPCILSLTGKNRLKIRTKMFFDGSTCKSSSWLNILMPV